MSNATFGGSMFGLSPPPMGQPNSSDIGVICPEGFSCVAWKPREWIITTALSSVFVGFVWGIVAKYIHSQYGKNSNMRRIPALATIAEDVESGIVTEVR